MITSLRDEEKNLLTGNEILKTKSRLEKKIEYKKKLRNVLNASIKMILLPDKTGVVIALKNFSYL